MIGNSISTGSLRESAAQGSCLFPTWPRTASCCPSSWWSSSSSCSCLIPPLTVEPFCVPRKSLLPNQQHYSVFLSTGTCQGISNRRKPILLPWIFINHTYGVSATNTKGREVFSRKTPRSKGCKNTALFACARPPKSQLTDLTELSRFNLLPVFW